MRALAIFVIAVVLGSGSAAAQSISGDALPPVFMGIHPVAPVSGEGAWTLQVISRGGVIDGGTVDLIITSTGLVKHVGGGERERMGTGELSTLTRRIRGIYPSHWAIGSRLGTCSDCVTTLLVLTVREPDAIRTYTAFWDATTRGGIPADVLEVHDLAVGRIRQVSFGK
ncbi:MAG TPA: hypothetical protein VKB50_00155 [Vicinamibacterales bacterium]|nr:hypothetical protein [Vicinamibacterales bacterium]